MLYEHKTKTKALSRERCMYGGENFDIKGSSFLHQFWVYENSNILLFGSFSQARALTLDANRWEWHGRPRTTFYWRLEELAQTARWSCTRGSATRPSSSTSPWWRVNITLILITAPLSPSSSSALRSTEIGCGLMAKWILTHMGMGWTIHGL